MVAITLMIPQRFLGASGVFTPSFRSRLVIFLRRLFANSYNRSLFPRQSRLPYRPKHEQNCNKRRRRLGLRYVCRRRFLSDPFNSDSMSLERQTPRLVPIAGQTLSALQSILR
jgi:hypothetical protein